MSDQHDGSRFAEELIRQGIRYVPDSVPHCLEGVRSKLDRADIYIGHLQSAIQRFASDCDLVGRDSDPYSFETYKRMERLMRPPLEISLLVGDISHNLRCSLDHLIHIVLNRRGHRNTILKPNGDRKYIDKQIQFPIFDSRCGFDHPGFGLKQWDGLHPSDEQLIRDLQPYNAGTPQEHPLFLLHTLNNVDKHRTVPVTTTFFEVRKSLSPSFFPLAATPVDFERGIGVSFPTYGVQLDINYLPTGDVLFGTGCESAEGHSVLDVIQSIRAYLHQDVFKEDGLIDGL